MTNQKPTATSRLKQDYMRLKRDPVPYITAEPLPSNILEWHYVIKGPEDSPYHGGYYHGTLLFTKEFPFKPPSIYMITPNGRFKTNKRLCLSISDFHPDTWNPAWSVATILTGLLSFMLETTPTLGSCESTTYMKRKFARQSLEFNMKNEVFCELFPEICEEINERLAKIEEHRKQNSANNNGPSMTTNGVANGTLPTSDGLEVEPVDGGATGVSSSDESNNIWHSLYTNLIVLIGFVIFALIVHYVIKSMNIE
ncbi:ubiquitin-conjugating enzyme E2 J2 [Topomyia yanbarensis]|uniref:ubiquitin-conjugating enzyme E2 J2 n=1 Tax=Topomyia yanbarensis TaxID=2498891 RepID=UPI00273CC831|nr:ubiquitin-conjugating enzyme E2 J2 [Topomyia yanbarensis]XP_058833465.1 ubiquitin-conjugating enzyme E2 J2 [Topomyia yanbarensis]XP_058833466.1 ubiquitin-conjugating enzyme E2 J2 [Topomyia yanbarensis]